MARPSKKSVYERIEEQQNKIKETEALLVKFNEELQVLFAEKDRLEMELLLEAMKAKGLNINEALAKMSGVEIQTEKPSKLKKNTEE
jgi:hypothetical protein